MVSCFISRLVILVFGTLYPAYASYKAVRTKNVREYVKWMMYWIVFALFTCAETFTDLFLSFWFPFYYEIKIITVIYLLSPATKGSSILYRKFVHPVLIKKEQEIDEYIAKAKQQGYHTMLNLGSKGVTYATSLIMHTAIKGGGGLVSQLRKSYSLSDLSEETNLRGKSRELADGVNSPYDEDPELNQRKIVNIPYQNSSSAGFFPGPNFPEVNDFQRPDLGYFRKVPSEEEISSGYSRGYSVGDSLYYDAQRPKTDNLVRTASLGPSYRVRTRAASKNALPKRASLSEGGSTWSALEPHGSQNETDERFNFFLSRSASLPFPFHSLQHINAPEYQQMLGNFTQNQIFTFINDSQYSQFINNKRPDFKNIPEEVLKKEKNVESNNSVIISEESCDNSKDQTLQLESLLKSDVSAITDLNEEKSNDSKISALNQSEKNNEENKITEEKKEENNVENEIQNEISCTSESLHNKAKSLQQRSGRYNKKPAPIPPGEDSCSKLTVNLTVEEEDTDFFTPNSSPNPTRKHTSISSDLSAEKNSISDSEVKLQDSNALEVIKKSKTKVKKTDFSIPKKLHMPKMSFSFWHQKGDKQALVSEGSPAASAELPTKQSENLEYYISLKEDIDKSDKTKEESKSD